MKNDKNIERKQFKHLFTPKEEKRDNCTPDGASLIIISYDKNDSSDEKNKAMKSLNTQLIIENQNNFLKEKLLRRKGNKQIKNKISLINNIMFLKLLMLIHLIQMLITNKTLFIEFYFSKITLKIKGFGKKKY